ncbi:MAG: RNA polymerase sigma factor [Gemmatimonadetes bacterium]|nr:RNA polymerase sigma factor [Gemmatimonadota bacterium]
MSDAHVVGDAELVGRVIRGEREAFAELVRRHQAIIYRHVRGMSIDHDTALDLLQDAFMRAWERLAECRDRAHFRAWLFRIARNACLDHLKDVRRLTTPLSTVAGAERLEADTPVVNDVDLTLRVALERLPVPLREAFLLKHDAGYTYDEIAAMTDTTPSAVKMRVHRAREALRLFLSEQGVHAV